MPSTTDERAARWPGSERQAMLHLRARGYVLSRDGFWRWSHPDPNFHADPRDLDAVCYLVEEWDWGWIDVRFWTKPEFCEEDFEEACQQYRTLARLERIQRRLGRA